MQETMSIYFHSHEVKPGVLVRALNRDHNIVPGLVMALVERTGFARVLLPSGETVQMNALYLERWK